MSRPLPPLPVEVLESVPSLTKPDPMSPACERAWRKFQIKNALEEIPGDVQAMLAQVFCAGWVSRAKHSFREEE